MRQVLHPFLPPKSLWCKNKRPNSNVSLDQGFLWIADEGILTNTKARWACRTETPVIERSPIQYVFEESTFHIELLNILFTVSTAVAQTEASGTWGYAGLFVSLMKVCPLFKSKPPFCNMNYLEEIYISQKIKTSLFKDGDILSVGSQKRDIHPWDPLCYKRWKCQRDSNGNHHSHLAAVWSWASSTLSLNLDFLDLKTNTVTATGKSCHGIG